MRGIGLITLGLFLTGAFAYQRGAATHAESPKVAAPVHSAPYAGSIRAEGRLAPYPGGEVTVSAEVDGRIVRLPVEEGIRVRRGELLVELASDEERAALAEARAQLAATEAALRFAESDLGRHSQLKEAQAVSDQSLDRTKRERDAAHARRDAARGTVERRAAHLAKTRITSPLSGLVITRHAEPGETVSPGAPILTIADPDRSRVEAEVDEFDAARLRVRAPVIIAAEGYEQTWRGQVKEISAAVTSRQLRPRDPGRPSDTRVVIVKVALDEPVPLRLGQRVEVEIGGAANATP
jgi:HlyD family secretion protein